jgi:hypothetical protein
MVLVLGIELGSLLLGGLGLAVVAAVLLLILFPDQAAFTPKMPGTPMAPGALPVVGHLLALPKYQASVGGGLAKFQQQADMYLRNSRRSMTISLTGTSSSAKSCGFRQGSPGFLQISWSSRRQGRRSHPPRSVSFPQGPRSKNLLGDFLGHGIFTQVGDDGVERGPEPRSV